jgi:hypothetical protein
MNLREPLLGTTFALLPLLCGAQHSAVNQEPPAESKAASASFKVETASVEEVLATDDDGFRSSAYVVRWHANRVLLVDPLASTPLAVGDDARFLVTHHEVGGNRLLSFVFTRNQDCGCKEGQRRTLPTKGADLASYSGGADLKTGIVDDVLGAEDEGYRAIGYIVQSQGKRIAVADPIAQSQFAIGDTMSFLAVRSQVKGSSLLAFTAMSSNAMGANPPPPAALSVTPTARVVTAPQSGVIEEVLTTSDTNYRYRAYVVEALGTRIVIEDSPCDAPHQVGEQLAFVSRHMPGPPNLGHGLLSFDLIAKPDGVDMGPEAAQVSMHTDTGTVDEVLTTDVNGDWYVAYIVKWNGARVAVSDVFASTHYAVGDRITFPVSSAATAGRGRLYFMMFNFAQPSPPSRSKHRATCAIAYRPTRIGNARAWSR